MNVVDLILVLSWLMPIVLVSLAIGSYLGYGFALRRKGREIGEERAKTLRALQAVLQSTETLSQDVDAHNQNLESVEKTVGELTVSDDFEEIQTILISQISSVIASNKHLEDDLVCTRYQLEQQAQELDLTRVEARTDALSGVGNRKCFEEAGAFMMSKFKRNGDKFALVLLDVDHFKWINDTHGHQAGDRVITIIGKMLRDLLRPRDAVARYGGDEFAILLADVDFPAAIKAAQRIRIEIDRTNFDCGVHGARIAVTFSMGLAMPSPDDSADSLLKKADKALYRSKNRGRNQLNWYEEDMEDSEGKCALASR